MRQVTDDGSGAAREVVANGSATTTFLETVSGGETTESATIAMGRGATLMSRDTRTTFASGSLSYSAVRTGEDERTIRSAMTHDRVSFDVDGIPYVSAGSLQFSIAESGFGLNISGEIVLWMNGRRIGRLFGAPEGLFTETDGVVQPFQAKVPRLRAL